MTARRFATWLTRYCWRLFFISILVGCSFSGLDYLKGETGQSTDAQLSDLEARLLVLERSQIDIKIRVGLQAQGIEELSSPEQHQEIIELGRALNYAAIQAVMNGADPFGLRFWEDVIEEVRARAEEDSTS